MNLFLPGQLLIRDGATLTIAPNDSTVEVRLGTEYFEDLKKANAKRRLAWPTGATHQTTKSVLGFEIVTHGRSGCSTALSPVLHTIYIHTNGHAFGLTWRRILYKSLSQVLSLYVQFPWPSSFVWSDAACALWQWFRPVPKLWPWLPRKSPIFRHDNLGYVPDFT